MFWPFASCASLLPPQELDTSISRLYTVRTRGTLAQTLDNGGDKMDDGTDENARFGDLDRGDLIFEQATV